MSGLRSRHICDVPCDKGRKADIVLIEPNGDEHGARCLVWESKTEISGQDEILEYLRGRYGDEALVCAVRAAILGP